MTTDPRALRALFRSRDPELISLAIQRISPTILACHGNLDRIVRRLEIPESTFRRWLDLSADLQRVLETARAEWRQESAG